jgi:long-chain-fatty-acid--CoA ligase ACSBG
MSGRGVHWITEPHEERPIRWKEGEAGIANTKPIIVQEVFKATAEKYGTKTALGVKRDGEWKTWTYQQYYDQTKIAAKALIKIGVGRFDGICILGFNSPEWFIADLGAIYAGAIVAGIYTTNGPEACQYIAEHAKASVIFVENESQLKKILQIRKNLPNLKKIVQWSGKVDEQEGVLSWEAFMALGKDVADSELNDRIQAQKPEHCCTLIYTSGTTGPPKAVMISHDNITWTSNVVVTVLEITENDSLISYLPLSHIAAQMVDIHGPLSKGVSVWFAQPDALKGSLATTLKEIRPTGFLGVPRVWEKIHEKMLEVGKANGGIAKTLAGWAKSTGLAANNALQSGKPENVPWGFWLADKVVFDKVKAALGLDRTRFCATAAAPIAREVLDYFLSLNIPIYEIYGMSECTGPATINHPGVIKTGTAGPVTAGTELRINDPDNSGNGEIVYRGRHIFMGYMHDEKSTAETIDKDGWLHSGDIGKLDSDGFLSITGRIKELIITAGGENVPPVLIEEEIKNECGNLVSNVMVVGDRQKFLTCLVTLRAQPEPNPAPNSYPFTKNLSTQALEITKAIGSSVTTVAEAIADPKIKSYIEEAIKKANKKATSNAQIIQKFEFIPEDFTIEGNELTPTLKLKRRIVVDKYSGLIAKMYDV